MKFTEKDLKFLSESFKSVDFDMIDKMADRLIKMRRGYDKRDDSQRR